MCSFSPLYSFFFFNDTATTEIYTLSLHDALPILARRSHAEQSQVRALPAHLHIHHTRVLIRHQECARSEEHTSELQSLRHLVCRLLLEKKKKQCKLAVVYHVDTYQPIHIIVSTGL